MVDLNMLNVPLLASSWKRKTRRASGWMNNSVRVILFNPLYIGRVRWNATQYVRNPDTGSFQRRRRPKVDWHVFQDESLRIISDEQFEQTRNRTLYRANPDKRLKAVTGRSTCSRDFSFVINAAATT